MGLVGLFFLTFEQYEKGEEILFSFPGITFYRCGGRS